MSNCNHKFGHILNIGAGTDYYMCSLCELEITEDHHALIVELEKLKQHLKSIECTTRALKVCHDLRGAVMAARTEAAKEACKIAAKNGCVDHRFMCAVHTSKAIADHFGLEK